MVRQTSAEPVVDPTSRCILCGADHSRQLFVLNRPILKCSSCALVYAATSNSPTTTTNYPRSYYQEGIYSDYLGDRGAIRRNAKRRLDQLARLTQGRELLDVGCAMGFFLEAARDEGWSVSGLEASTYASSYAREELGLAVDTLSITSHSPASSKFDVITMWDTIEHLDRPDLALQNIRRLLRPGGVLAFSTGDYNSLLRRATGRRWRLFADPTHNFFFTEEALRRMLMESGYEVVSVDRRGKWVSLSLILHQSRLPFSATFRRLLSGRGWNPAFYINLRDVVTVYARALPNGAGSIL